MGVIEAFDVPCPLSKPLHVTMDSFYKLRIKQAMEVYDKIVEHFWNSVLKVPTLVFYSENDPLCDSLYIQEILSKWRRGFLTMTSLLFYGRNSDLFTQHIWKNIPRTILENWENWWVNWAMDTWIKNNYND